MGQGNREERERLREQRLAAEGEASSQRTRLIAAYSIAAIFVLALAVLIVILASDGGSSAAKGDAHLNLSSGSTNGIAPDERAGTPPPAVKVSDLAAAAKRA